MEGFQEFAINLAILGCSPELVLAVCLEEGSAQSLDIFCEPPSQFPVLYKFLADEYQLGRVLCTDFASNSMSPVNARDLSDISWFAHQVAMRLYTAHLFLS